ncbi:MAG: ribonuclease HI [Bacteriovoracaceae bacterium]|nr:ribonuclease HI [Bacteriovoracaceae bacterium]
MSKKRYLHTLTQILEHFDDDKDVVKAIAVLHEKIVSKDDWEEDMANTPGDMEVPAQIAGKEGYFAVFSDGACRGNPGPGSWGAVGQDSKGEIIFESSGVDVPSTNNRMEMEGALQAMNSVLFYAQEKGESIEKLFLFSDSKYVVEGMKTWRHGWKKRGWKKSDNKPPENVELWQQLDQVSTKFKDIQYEWVKGHAGHPQNERCDQLANEALDDAGF